MNRRNFITTLTLFLLLPKSLWAKNKSNLIVKDGWILKNEDL